jgi:hypothetical protein
VLLQCRRQGRRADTLILDMDTVWVSGQIHAPAARYPRENPATDWIGGSVGLGAGLEAEAAGEILCLCRGSNPDRPVVQPVARHYTD